MKMITHPTPPPTHYTSPEHVLEGRVSTQPSLLSCLWAATPSLGYSAGDMARVRDLSPNLLFA